MLIDFAMPEAASSAKAITAFSIGGSTGVITGLNIAVTVPNGSDLTMLTPTIVSSGASVLPASGSAATSERLKSG